MKNTLVLALLATVLVFGSWAQAGELVITSPAEGSIIAGAVVFTASVQDLPAVVAVDWRLNGRSISGSLMTPPTFARPWHPAEVFNGPMTLQAMGLDAAGKMIASSPLVHFSARVGPGDMKLDAPKDLTKPLAGVVRFTVTAIRPLTAAERKQREEDPKFDKSQMGKTVECVQFFVDGQGALRQFGAPTRTLELDTARLPNGCHELQISANAWLKDVPDIGMLQTTFTTDNGHAPMALLPRWEELCLQPGETAELAPRLAFTDETIGPLDAAPVYVSSKTAVATVDARGRVQAVGKGVATISLSLPARALLPTADEKAKPYAASVRVVVGLPNGLPHFARNGRVLLHYDPKQSIFVRSMFMLPPLTALNTPGLAELVKDAGVNTCESGFFYNPNDGSRIDSLQKYIHFWDPWFETTIVRPARKLGVGMILIGDDWVRTSNELKWTAATPWALDLAKHIWAKVRDSGVATSIEMMDEANLLGDSPAPTDGHWAKADPAIHDKTLVNLIAAIRSVENHTPITWPVLGLTGPEAAARWMGDPRYADYATQYWTVMDYRAAYPWATSGPQMKSDLERVMVQRFPLLQWDRPQLMLVSGCGPYYTKKVAGDHFHPGLDEGLPCDPSPALIADQPLYAALSGAAGVRVYSFDVYWKSGRAQAKLGAGGLQTGTSPLGAGSDRWHALSAAFNLLARLEPYLLQPRTDAIALGADFSTGARRGGDSRLLMAINWSQAPRKANVDLTPYLLPGVQWIERYRVLGGTSSVDVLAAAPQDALTFRPGEFVAWLARAPGKAGDAAPPAVRLAMPYEPTISGPWTLHAETNDNGAPTRVEFFVNGKLIGAATKAPYAITWDGVTALKGEWHSLKAVAVDAAGNQSEARAMVRVAGSAP